MSLKEIRLILMLRVSTNEEVDSIISAELPTDPEAVEEGKGDVNMGDADFNLRLDSIKIVRI